VGKAISLGGGSIAAFLLAVDTNRLRMRLLPDVRLHGVEVGGVGKQAVENVFEIAGSVAGVPLTGLSPGPDAG